MSRLAGRSGRDSDDIEAADKGDPTGSDGITGITLAQREQRLGWAMVAPAVLVVGLLVIFPVVWNVVLSTRRVRLIELRDLSFWDIDFSLKNYRRVTGVRGFWESIRVSFYYSIFGTLLSIALGLWAALVVKKVFIGRAVVRGFMLFPYIAPVIAVTFVWRMMLNPSFGILNHWVTSATGERIDFLGSRSHDLSILGFEFTVPLALTTVILFEAWRYFPFAYLFILARLQAMPSDLEDAGQVDGATPSQYFMYVTLPQLKGVLSVLFLLRFIWTFNKFDDVYLLTGGSGGTNVVTVQIVEWLRGRGDAGAAAALAIVLAGFLCIAMLVYFKWFYTAEESE